MRQFYATALLVKWLGIGQAFLLLHANNMMERIKIMRASHLPNGLSFRQVLRTADTANAPDGIDPTATN